MGDALARVDEITMRTKFSYGMGALAQAAPLQIEKPRISPARNPRSGIWTVCLTHANVVI
jgi:hypothetical protein